MKDFSSWGVKTRSIPESNYKAVWSNLKTLRVGFTPHIQLPPHWSEFYDVSLGRMCNGHCPFCYTDARAGGKTYQDVALKIEHLCSTIWKDPNHRPFQVAIGSEGEPTLHPEFGRVCETFFHHGIVPNYTTNGVTLVGREPNKELLEITSKYVGGVAVSVYNWNPWRLAVRNLLEYGNTNVNLHIIISDMASVSRLKEIYEWGGDDIHTYVLLPLMAHGRSKESMSLEAFHALQDFLTTVPHFKFALGALMYPWLQHHQDPSKAPIRCSIYEPEMYSKNLILDDPIRITPSSYDTETTAWAPKAGPWSDLAAALK